MVEKRRPKGSGSIYTLKDGIVVGRYEVDTPEGKKRKYIRGKTKREVASKLARAIADRDSGLVYDSGNLAVGQYLDTFLDSEKGTGTGDGMKSWYGCISSQQSGASSWISLALFNYSRYIALS